MARVAIRLVTKSDGKTTTTEHEGEEGPATGKQIRRLLGVKRPQVLYSVDVWGHVQERQGAIEDDEVIFLRKGREFFAKNGDK